MAREEFAGMRVLALEARRAAEIATLIQKAGGMPQVAPALREVPLAMNAAAAAFASGLERGAYDWVVFLTAGGVEALTSAGAGVVAALRSLRVAARGTKTASALRALHIPLAAVAAEPATWRELLDAMPPQLARARIALQEYGAANSDLRAALTARGALVTAVPVYRWELPTDTAPLRAAIADVIDGRIDVVLFTNAVQVKHLFEVATQEHAQAALVPALRRCVLASIGPSTSAELAQRGCPADCEPSHPRMGVLVQETARQARALWQRKRTG